MATSPSPSPSPAAPGSQPGGPPKLVNLYYRRQVATSKSCFVCHRETTCCLATQPLDDFLYVCPSHLLDPGFARPAPGTSTPAASPSPAGSPSPASPVPQSEIDKVKKEYEDKQKSSSSDKDKDKADAAAAKPPASTPFSLLKTGASALSSLTTSAQSSLFPPPAPPVPSAAEQARAAAKDAKVFVLQRDFFRMRCDAKRREWEKRDAKERGAGWSFPKAPRGGLPGA
ncbi:VPS4-associated protein 1 [Rhodotorula diobovata]|uniref:VPS4-associated protein 1 n=1 Tax=Rhodotorula diobovata TaxID=5288 RepID=A0A5C5FLI8_9BASI|nr:VPS4-associated protein 1 [Rhodotorula diobovata]